MNNININEKIRAFSLAEIMVVLVIFTIIMAATMPILTKKTKVKMATQKPVLTCIKMVNTYLPTTTLTSDIKSLNYTLIGGGGGSSYHYSSYYFMGGAGGSSAILIGTSTSSTHDLAEIVANGGSPGSSATSYQGQSGSVVKGNISGNLLTTGHTITIYVGGGGGKTASGYGGGGGGGAGYFGGGGGYNYSGGGTPSLTLATGGTNQGGAGGCYKFSVSITFCAGDGSSLKGGDSVTNFGGRSGTGGNGIHGGLGDYTNYSLSAFGGGGGFGGSGGGFQADVEARQNYGQIGGTGTGQGGINAGGGTGGSATLIYTTTASSCPL